MNYTVHVPDNIQYIETLEKMVSQNNLTIKYLHPDSKSFHIFGDQKNIDIFLKNIEKYEIDNVFAFASDNTKSSVKTYIKNTRKIEFNSEENNPYFNAKELAQIYNISGTQATRADIAIIELGGGYNLSDLTTYWKYLGLTIEPLVYAISVDGAQNSPGNDADTEVVLDIEVVGGICPNSNIYVYFAPNTHQGFYDAIHNAIYSTTHPVSVISISWGSPENTWDMKTMAAFNNLFEQAANKGITVCVASGDSGSSDGEYWGNHTDFPASSPWVLACGGTNLVCPNKVYDNSTKEIVWGTIPNDGAAGGGFSTIFEKPSWQTDATKSYSTKMRGIPDISGDADPLTGWIIYINQSYTTIGGTSPVPPMWAAYLAGIGFGHFVNPILYDLYQSHKAIVHDILIGNEGAFSAKNGWDPASGLGSPNGNILTPLLKDFNEKQKKPLRKNIKSY